MNPKGQTPKPKKFRNDSFIESLRDLTAGTGKAFGNDLLKEIPKDIFRQTVLGPQRPTSELMPDDFLGFEEVEAARQKSRQTELVRKQEEVLFSSREKETKLKISVLYEEVKKLAHAQQNLVKEVQIAALQAPVDPGTYHVSFFEKLISFVKSLSKSLEDASVWLATANKRSKKRSYYWTQVGQSGSKFMLSQERYMSTQAG